MNKSKRKSESQETLEKLLKRIKANEDDVSIAISACAGQSHDGSAQKDGGKDADDIEDSPENPEVIVDDDKENQGKGETMEQSEEIVDEEIHLKSWEKIPRPRLQNPSTCPRFCRLVGPNCSSQVLRQRLKKKFLKSMFVRVALSWKPLPLTKNSWFSSMT